MLPAEDRARRDRGQDADGDGEARLHQRDRPRRSSVAETISTLFSSRAGVESSDIDAEEGVIQRHPTDPVSREAASIQSAQQQDRPGQRSAIERISGRSLPSFLANASSDHLITAHLVEEIEGEVVVAQRMTFFERKWSCAFKYGFK